MAGRNAGSAGDSSTPVPNALATSTSPGAPGLHQAGHAERRIAAQLERIAEVVVEAAQDGVHAAQAADRLQVTRRRRAR